MIMRISACCALLLCSLRQASGAPVSVTDVDSSSENPSQFGARKIRRIADRSVSGTGYGHFGSVNAGATGTTEFEGSTRTFSVSEGASPHEQISNAKGGYGLSYIPPVGSGSRGATGSNEFSINGLPVGGISSHQGPTSPVNYNLNSFLPYNSSINDKYDPNNSNCICPEASGWTPEQLVEHQKVMNLTGGPFDCFCLGPKGFALVQQNSFKAGYSNSERENGNAPTMSCFCPKPQGWSTEQFSQLRRQKRFTGGLNDCFCTSPSEIPDELSETLKSSRVPLPQNQERDQSHLSIISLDGDLKEVRLGPLLVTLH